MSGTIDGEHARRMAAFQRDAASLPALREKMEQEVDLTAKTTMRKRIREIEAQESDYLLKVGPLFQKAGGADEASTRGDLYAEYIALVGDTDAREKLKKFESDREMEVLMANSRKRRKGVKRKGPCSDITSDFECTDPNCGGTRIKCEAEASMVCTKCGLSEEWQEANMPFGTGVFTTSSQYLRKNHLNEVLLQVQGLEKSEVPAEVVEAVRNQLTVHKVHDMKKVTRALVRKYLRDLKHIKVTRKDGTTYITEGPKFYKHTSQIAQRISGRQEVVIPPWITRKIRQMFSVIEVAFDEIRPEYRKNFSNYAPVINHLLELLDDPEADRLMRFFPKLKSKDKHLDQEVLWEKACNRVQWQYIRH